MDDLPQVTKMTGPLLVFGGPYSNLEATEAILAEARSAAASRLIKGRYSYLSALIGSMRIARRAGM